MFGLTRAVTANVMEMLNGESIEIDIPGPIICVAFVSAQGCGSFRIESNGETAIIHTLHRGVRDGKHAFLPLSAYGPWWQESLTNHRVSIAPIPYHKGPADWPVDLVVSSSSENPVVYLYKILYRTH